MRALLTLAVCAGFVGSAFAETDQKRGSVTDLPIPRFVSTKSAEANARRGPAMDQKVDWVFVRRNLPLKVTDEYGHWRRVEDNEGKGGWVHYSLLSGSRNVLIQSEEVVLRNAASQDATPIARAEAGVIAALDRCETNWCRLEVNGHAGWAAKSALWGVVLEEVSN